MHNKNIPRKFVAEIAAQIVVEIWYHFASSFAA